MVPVLAAPARACDTPVYRYALANWPADLYRVTVLHAGPLSAEAQQLVAQLEEARSANLTVEVRPVAMTPDGRPRLEVRFPTSSRQEEPVWSVPLTTENVARLLRSPRRDEMARRLQAEETVWLFLPGGDAPADDRAEALLRKELTSRPASAPAATLLRVSPDDSREELLVRLLRASEPDLPERGEPMVFPVFGRGRVLYALVGDGIHPGTIAKALGFLGGACSCTVKKENPGIDLLLSAEWTVPAAPEPTAPPEPVAESAAAPEVLPPPRTSTPRPFLWAAIAAAGALVLVTGWRAVRSGRTST